MSDLILWTVSLVVWSAVIFFVGITLAEAWYEYKEWRRGRR